MIASRNGICIKCSKQITAGKDEISWTRKPRLMGLRSAAWHLSCKFLLDNFDTMRQLLAEQNAQDKARREGYEIPQTIPQTITQTIPQQIQHTENESMPNGDFLAGMADAMVPYLQGKIGANLDSINAQVNEAIAGLDGKLEAMLDSRVKTIAIEDKETHELKNIGAQHYAFEKLLKVITTRNAEGFYTSAYLYGDPGSGKTSAARKIAEALSLDFRAVSLNLQSTPTIIMGYMDAHGTYQSTDFYEVYKNGGVYLFDEGDNASGNFLTSLNSPLANGFCMFPCGMVRRHKDAIFIVTGNTTGYGHNPKYPERQVLSGAIKERFAFINWGYDESFERTLALAMHEDKERTAKWVKWVQTVRKYALQYDKKLEVTPRASIDGVRHLDNFEPLEVAHMMIFRGYDADSITRIIANNPVPVF